MSSKGGGPLADIFNVGKSASTSADKHATASPAGPGRLSVERVYQKKTPLEHILLRPDTYIGSVEPVTQQMWVVNNDSELECREITFVPGLYKIFDEILVNACDNRQRDHTMSIIKIDIDPTRNMVRVWNNGKGIPVVMHKTEKVYVPTLIFGHLLTGSNFNDDDKKVTGGRNGYGAKLCNVFSSKFKVETLSREYKKRFSQTWHDNMSRVDEAFVESESSKEEYTKITFFPDLAKFKMSSLDDDTVALFKRRAFDCAATAGVKVFLNGKQLPVKNFKDYALLYIKGREDEVGNPLELIYEKPAAKMANGESCTGRWEFGLTSSDGFRQISFVNSIATTKGGRHVDYILDQIVSRIISEVKKKHKTASVKPHQVKNHLWLFCNCLVENPTFDSQTKENMTLQSKQFGSSITISDDFFKKVVKSGIVESVVSFIKMKEQGALNNKMASKKVNTVKGIPKLDDANKAGGPASLQCTLILTEGDSAKTLAVAGLSVLGRDHYGIFPLRGKLLNTREANTKQILENQEIQNITKIVGLNTKQKYEDEASLKTLRYGKIMIMADQDQDGSHIKGLVINFIHHHWPRLLRHKFVEEFITPIIKIFKGKDDRSFYSIPEFEEWKAETPNWHTYRVKYYKGLGTSTSNEAKEYFSDLLRHKIPFKYSGDQDDKAIELAFSKSKVDDRKAWLTQWMNEKRERAISGDPEEYLYNQHTRSVTYQDFVNKELILFSNMDVERSVPSAIDGFKPGQRKVLFTCLKLNIVKEVKVAQLSGTVAQKSSYHHGEVSLAGTIVNMAQNYVGSNNINLLLPLGQFGTRLHGGKDSASTRYIFTALAPLARALFPKEDDAILHYLYDDNQKIEPNFYIPIIPMVLVNGADGIGTGWSTSVQNFNPREIFTNLRRLIDGEEMKPMQPWFKGFFGHIEPLGEARYITHGRVSVIDDDVIEITELPVGTWTQTYKEQVIERLAAAEEAPKKDAAAAKKGAKGKKDAAGEQEPAAAKKVPIIDSYSEYHTDKTVRFVVRLRPGQLEKLERGGDIFKVFKLQSSLSMTNMVLFDANNVIKRYDNALEIMRDFFDTRLAAYVKRKAYLVGLMAAEAKHLTNRARFIKEINDKVIEVRRIKKSALIAMLRERKYDPDPIATWKKAQVAAKAIQADEEEGDNAAETEEAESDKPVAGEADYGYLIQMALWNLTEERMKKLMDERDTKLSTLEVLRATTERDMYRSDMDNLEKVYEETLAKEAREDAEASTKVSKRMDKAKASGKSRVGGATLAKVGSLQTKPDPLGRGIEPTIDEDKKKQIGLLDMKARGEKPVKKEKKVKAEPSENIKKFFTTDDRPLRERLGVTSQQLKRRSKGSGARSAASDSEDSDVPLRERVGATAAQLKRRTKGGAARTNAGSESDEESDVCVLDDEDLPPPRELPKRERATKKVVVDISDESEEEEEDDDSDFMPEEDSPPRKQKKSRVIEESSDEEPPVKKAPVQAAKKPRSAAASDSEAGSTNAEKRVAHDSDDDFNFDVDSEEDAPVRKPIVPKAPVAKAPKQTVAKVKPAAAAKPPPKRKLATFTSEEEDEESDVGFDTSPVAPRDAPKRSRAVAAKSYAIDSDSD